MKRVLVVCPQDRDRREIAAAGLHAAYDVALAGPDLDRVHQFDARAFVAGAETDGADGVVGTKDRSALLAAIVAERAGLPGPSPRALAAVQHKLTSRALQRAAVPDAVPRFARIDQPLPFAPPFFVKPVVGRLSQGASRVDDVEELAALAALDGRDGYADRWHEIARLGGFDAPARGVYAEELLVGDEVTVEGYVHRGAVTAIGVTDAVKYPGTNSFERFEYPSRLAAERQEELAALAAAAVHRLALDDMFFNVEFAVADGRRPLIIEVNGRIASQFAPLVRALHGRSTYDALLSLACGVDPAWQPERPDGVAVSHVVRIFDDAYVAAVPEPDADVEVLVESGRRLSEQPGANDVASFRLAIVYAAGATRSEAVERARRRAQALTFELTGAP